MWWFLNFRNCICTTIQHNAIAAYLFSVLRTFVYRLQTNRGTVMKILARDEGLFAAFSEYFIYEAPVCCSIAVAGPVFTMGSKAYF